MSAVTVDCVMSAAFRGPGGLVDYSDQGVDEALRVDRGEAQVLVSLDDGDSGFDKVTVEDAASALEYVRRAIVALQTVEAGLSGMLGTD